jgi:hypothetical protein
MTEVSDTVSLAQKLMQPEPKIIKDARGIEWLLLPQQGTWNCRQLTPDSEIAPKPAYAEARAAVHTTTSLINYLNRFKTADTMIFADLQAHKLVAVIDYHSAGSAAPGLRKHAVTLQLTHSNEWETWTEADDELYEQKKFARFLEENKLDVLSPAGGDLLEIVLDMEKGVNMRVGRKMVSAGSDRGNEGFSRDVDGTELPPVWTLAIPVFTGEPNATITAYARDELDDGKLKVGFKLSKIENVKESELTRIALLVGTETSLPVVLGTPG